MIQSTHYPSPRQELNLQPEYPTVPDTRSSKFPRISIVVFIDALGWEVLHMRNRGFLEKELPHRRKLRSVFGFSSACIPSILSGLMPRDHRHWSFFYYAPQTSPFKLLGQLGRWLPSALVDRGRVRNMISKIIKKIYGYTGYFQIYSMPFARIGLFDYCEKKDLFKPGGLNQGQSIFDHLAQAKTKYHVSDWRASEETNLAAVKREMPTGDLRFALLYMASMDALLHQVGKESPLVDEKLAWYENQLRQVMEVAHAHYEEVRFFVCSDHGMATVHTHVDVAAQVDKTGMVFNHDYVATFDSTMGRFWFLRDGARERITAALKTIPQGNILSDEELQKLGCDFAGNQYGELIFLMNPGVLILPSDMGNSPITGMHGYHPDHPDSNASLLSNVEPPLAWNAIPHMFQLMREEAGA